MPLTGYFDETGYLHDLKVSFAGMAGIVATVEAWKVFERDWAELLKSESFPELHMKELAHFTRAFKGWDEVKRRRVIGRACEIILATEGTPVGSIVDLRAYRQLDSRVRERLHDPYYMCLNVCVHGAMVCGLFDEAEWMAGRPFEFANEKVNLVFDENHQMATSVPSLMALLRKRPLYNGQIGDYTFSSSTNQLPLQAADLVAYEFGRSCKNMIAGRPPIYSWPLRQIFQMSGVNGMVPWFSVYDAATLQKIEQAMLKMIARKESEQEQQRA